MQKVDIHPDAKLEIEETASYYQEHADGLGMEFLDELKEGFNQILKFPWAYGILEGEFRRYLLKRFPYGIVYRIGEESIFIISVGHLHRKPGYWKNRKLS
ncbi:MAG: type II toxin-antitoxin system RelE/ParE family toxin [Planctomycetes bacterium]|nr:type II toxin-antitoxin system RelE/ParE family toxin [Planctomycetota bacterium]